MMKVADVTAVAWQQMCVSSWQRSAASPASGGGRARSSSLGVCMSLPRSVCFGFFCHSRRQTTDVSLHRLILCFRSEVGPSEQTRPVKLFAGLSIQRDRRLIKRLKGLLNIGPERFVILNLNLNCFCQRFD